ncbi:hypothetical protein CKAH01_14625 [Colletotrichum kahawae]|uniref:F-box domain-containing protein n=1 Tax=Colletotrichum kahawae TaxID=34407 RepID=A0AAD9YJS7_COLKA|nr:hypothetical protein CKAH01_14625 [Colletotrichum kahawae]
MDRLPQEIVDDIIDLRFIYKITHPYNVKFGFISQFATVSRKFQRAIERLLFRTIEISNLKDDIQMFESLFSASPYRRDFIKRVTLCIKLDLRRIMQESYEDLDIDQTGREASRAVSEMLLILSAWMDRQAIRLTINCQTWGNVVLGGMAVKGQHRRSDFTVIELPDLDPLLAAQCIRSLEAACNDASPELHPFPKLDDHILARADSEAWSELEQLMDFVTARYHADFCATMHSLLNNFTKLDYRGILEPYFLWPHGASEQPAPFWQSMTYLSLQFEPVNLSGKSYFKTGEELPWSGPLQFQRTPKEDVMMPLIEAMCKALNQMPNLRTFQMFCNVNRMSRGGCWRLSYAAPGVPSNFDKHVEIPLNKSRESGGGERAVDHDAGLGSGNGLGAKSSGGGAEASKSSRSTDDSSLDHVRSFPRWLLDAGDWKPSAEILEALQRVGSGIHGQDAFISFVPF